MGETLIYVADTSFLGRVGSAELGAIALVDVGIALLAVPIYGLVEAMQIIVSRRKGEARETAVGSTFLPVLLLVAAVSLLLAIAARLGSQWLGPGLAGSEHVAEAVRDFFAAGAAGIVLMSLNLALASLYVGIGRARVLVGATVVLVAVNTALSYMLVLGHLGAPSLGMKGAGWAFAGAEGAAFLYLSAHYAARIDHSRYGLRPFRWDGMAIRPLIRLALPVAVIALVEAVRWLVFFLIIGSAGENELAASSVVYACYGILVMPTFVSEETAYSLVSNIIGQGRATQIRSLLRRITIVAYLITLPLLVVVFAFPDAALSVFTSDPEALHGAREALLVVGLGMFVVIPAQVWQAALLGVADADAAAGIELLLSGLVLTGSATAVIADLGLGYVWASVPAASAICLLAAWARLRSGRWKLRQV